MNVWVANQQHITELVAAELRIVALAVQQVVRHEQGADLFSSREMAGLRELLTKLSRRAVDNDIHIIARDGTIVASINADDLGGASLINQQRPDYLRRTLSGETVMIPPLEGANGSPTMFFAAPLRNVGGDVIAVFAQSVDPQTGFSRINRLGRIGNTGETYAFDRDGKMLSESRFPTDLISARLVQSGKSSILSVEVRDPGRNLVGGQPSDVPRDAKPLTRMAASATKGEAGYDVDGYRDYRGVPVMGAWIWDQQLDLGMTTEIDVAEAMEAYYRARLAIIVILSVTLLVSIAFTLLSIILGSRANRSLKAAHDQLEQRVEQRTDDFREAKLKAEQALADLEESEVRQTAIVDNMVDAVIVTNHEGNIERFTGAAEQMFGYAAEEAIGRTVTMLVPSEVAVQHDGNLQLHTQTGEPHVLGVAHEVVARKKDGTEFPAELAVVDFEIHGIRMYSGVIHDISTRKQAENELRRARDTAEAATRAKSTFLASMSHEIRTPMNGVVGMIDLLGESELDDDQRSMVTTVKNSAFSLLRIINDILDFPKIEADKLKMEKIPVSVLDAVEEVAETLAPAAHKKGVLFVTFVDPNIPDWVLGDAVRLRQILFNLAGNAVKFTKTTDDKTGIIEVRADLLSNGNDGNVTIRYSVKDNGIGISKEAQDRLFDAFEQAEDATTRRYGGTGLGLTIFRRLTELNIMGGEIGVEGELGAGSTFSATIPHQRSDKKSTAAETDLAGVRVMIVHESARVREMFVRYLEHWRAETIAAEDADSAFEIALAAASEDKPIDVAVIGAGWDLDEHKALRQRLMETPELERMRFVFL